MILEAVTKFVAPKNIILILSNFDDEESDSSDIDIYCITNRGRSAVHLFYTENREWTEVFVDTMSDVLEKFNNVDEIAINFIRQLRFVSGDRGTYDILLNKATVLVREYRLPAHRKNVLKYRIKVLLSKYLNPNEKSPRAQEHFILNAISYPLVQLVLEHHGIFPASPKLWLRQLEETLPEQEFKELANFLSHRCNEGTVRSLCEKYAGEPDPMHFQKARNDNTTTVLS